MPTVDEPLIWDRTIYRGTDHAWRIRRVDLDLVPIIPTSARAQIRQSFGSELWIETTVEIEAVTGWITVRILKDATLTPEWGTRKNGVWDLEVILDGSTYRWAMGKITVSQDVTR